MKRHFPRVRSCLLLASAFVLLISRTHAQTLTTLHYFLQPAVAPASALVQGSDGNFYGTTQSGGGPDEGTVYKITPSGAETVLYSFGTKPYDGTAPAAALVQGSDGNFYGTTSRGGSQGNGTVFKITPSGTETVLYSFGTNPDDGTYPYGLVEGSDGNFYGTTNGGGSQGNGTAFKITPSGSESVLYRFGANPNDGRLPQSALIKGSDGNFYGISGGGSQSEGTVFKITPSGTETVLYSFGTNPNDGRNPTALVQGSDGNFYGTTYRGGSQDFGAVVTITPLGAETVLYSFGTNADDGSNPLGLLKASDGNFYGTASSGGSQGSGAVVRITPLGAETVLYSFGTNPNDGFDLESALVQGSDGNVYGTSDAGGSQNLGTVFKITPSGTETVLYSFGNPTGDGSNPLATLVQGSDRNFYGTTFLGTADGYGLDDGYGTVFKITPSGAETQLYNFGTNPDDGANPRGALVQGSDGNFYGTTFLGGLGDDGTVFKITPSGTETVLYRFGTNPNDGKAPLAALVLGSDGNFYGTTDAGGQNNDGTVFKITPSGTETVLYRFGTNPNDGFDPEAALVQGSDGNFYGTTHGGGSHGFGTVFKITPFGTETVLYSFGTNPNDGINPIAGLVQGSDGNFYGTTSEGGSQGVGTVFRITPSGAETVLYSFGTNPNDGGYPTAAVVQGSDGNFYGTTSVAGTVYKITPSGTETVLYSFGTIPNDGTDPESGLIQGSDGNLYGTTAQTGEIGGSGTVFKLTLNSQFPVANNDQAVLTNASFRTINVLANDSDPNNLPLTVTAVTQPSMGQVQNNGDGTITYIPHQSFLTYSGTDSFTYTISNGTDTATATVTIGNPFFLQKGSFAGTLSNPGGGYLTLTVSGLGAFSGRLRLGKTAFALTGQFDLNGDYTTTVNGHTLTLHFDVENLAGNAYGNYTITGSYDGDALSAYHAIYNALSNPAPQAGYYTVLLPAVTPTSAVVPAGTGYATLAVSLAGKVTLVGVLADGSKISDGVYITGGGTAFVNQFPIYASLPYKAAGSIVGAITFENTPGVSDCDGTLFWDKPAQIATGIYKAGFDTTLSAIGSRYAKPPAQVLALNLATGSSNADVALTEPDFAVTITKQVTVAIGGALNTDSVTVNNPSTDALVMSINSKTGLFLGTFKHPVSGKTVKLQGALLHKQNAAGGYFIGPVQSGAVSLAAP